MAEKVAELSVVINADAQKAISQLSSFEKKMQATSKNLESVGKKASLFVTAPLLAAGGAAFKLASDLNESFNKVDVAFGTSGGAVRDWSETTLTQFGIAQGSALDMVSTFGDMGTSMGIPTDRAADMSTKMVGLAGDLASFKNISADTAAGALKGIFTGEGEALKGLGIVMNDTNLRAWAMKSGMKANTDQMSQAELVTLRYNYVTAMAANSTGDFSRTSGGAANQMRMATEGIKQLGASLGAVLIPIITPLIVSMNEWIAKFTALDEGTKTLIVTVLAIVAAIGPLIYVAGVIIGVIGTATTVFTTISGAIAVVTTGVAAATPAIGGLAAAFSFITGPIGLAILAIAAVAAIVVYAWNNITGFKEIILGAWDAVKAKTAEIFGSYIIPFFQNQLVPMFNQVFSTIRDVVSGTFNFIMMVWNTILKPVFDVLMIYIRDVVLPVWQVVFSTIGGAVGAVFTTIGNLWNNSLKPIFSGILTFISGVFTGDWRKAWDGISSIFSGVWEGLKELVKSPINFIIGGLNGFIKGVNKIKIPDWVPGVGGLSLSLPSIPSFAVGTRFLPQDMIVQAHKGEMITPASENPYKNSGGAIGAGSATSQNIELQIQFGKSIYREIIKGINEEQRYAGKTLITL